MTFPLEHDYPAPTAAAAFHTTDDHIRVLTWLGRRDCQ